MNIQNTYKNDRTKLGNWLFYKTLVVELFLFKHLWLYILLNLTWGILMNIVGALTTLLFVFAKPSLYYCSVETKAFKHWGGLDLGLFHLRDTTSIESLSYHEMGHAFQNAIYGPFFIFLIAIPSAIRYWTITSMNKWRRKHGKPTKAYDSVWFEGNATECGREYKVYKDTKEAK